MYFQQLMHPANDVELFIITTILTLINNVILGYNFVMFYVLHHHKSLSFECSVSPVILLCSCGSVVEHCVSSTKAGGFNSRGTHILMKNEITSLINVHSLELIL